MSHMTLRNTTDFIAQYLVMKGDQVVARIPGIGPNAQMKVPTNNVYQVVATAIIEGNTYTSAPLDVTGATGFKAQVIQVQAQGTYEFDVVETASLNASQLQFQKTCLMPVTFKILKNGQVLQSVVVSGDFKMKTVNIGDTYSIFAIINGVTTDTVSTTNPRAIITAITDDTIMEHDYFTLVVG